MADNTSDKTLNKPAPTGEAGLKTREARLRETEAARDDAPMGWTPPTTPDASMPSALSDGTTPDAQPAPAGPDSASAAVKPAHLPEAAEAPAGLAPSPASSVPETFAAAASPVSEAETAVASASAPPLMTAPGAAGAGHPASPTSGQPASFLSPDHAVPHGPTPGSGPGTAGGPGGPAAVDMPLAVMGSNSGAVTEDQQLFASGQLAAVGGHRGQPLQWQVAAPQGQFGTLTVDAQGGWQYRLDNSSPRVQALAEGQRLIEQFAVTLTDDRGNQVNTIVRIQVTGREDVPVLSAQQQSVSEDGQRLTGHMLATDVDTGDTQTFTTPQSVAGFTLNPDGSYVFDPSDAAYQHLAAGQTLTLIIPITVTDSVGASSTQDLTLTLTGSNDGARITGTDSGQLAEDGKLQCSGQLTVADVDDQEARFTPEAGLAGQHGVFALTADGHWTYVLDNTDPAIQALGAQASLQDAVTVHSVDGTRHTLTVTITGSNDAPVLSAQTQAVTEDGAPLNGRLLATDVDAGDTKTFSTPQAVAGFMLNPDGSYVFDPSDAAYQHLAAGQTQTLTIPVTVTDSTGASSTQSLSITITGRNDAANIAGVSTGSSAEDSRQAVTGRLTITDLDDGQAHFVAQSAAAGRYGTFTLNEQGQWSYQLDNGKPDVQALKNGDSVTDSFTVTSADGTPHTVSITVAGRDDGAVIAGTDQGAVTEDKAVQAGHLQAGGQLTITDADAGQAQFAVQTDVVGSGGFGHFSVEASGAWRYRADNTQTAIQQLKAGESLTDTLIVTSADGTTHTLTVTLHGSNDAPLLQAQTQSVTEDGALLNGRLRATDVDAGDTQTFSVASAVDGFTLNADGSYHFDPGHASYQHLAAGQTQDVVIPVTVTDSAGATSTQNLILTIAGSNDRAVIGGVNVGAVTEDTTLTASGKLTIRDVDSAQAEFVAQNNLAATHGSFTLSASGDWTYALDNSNAAVQALKTGESLTDTITVNSIDGTQHTITVTINGRNDGAVIAGVDTAAVTEDVHVAAGKIEANGQLTISDPDAGQAQFIAQATTPGAYGEFAIDAAGAWHYQADNSRSEIQQLKAGATLTDTFTVTSTDGTTHQIHVTITGSNDAPVIAAQTQSVTEDGASLSGKMMATDVDSGDTQTFSIAQPVDGLTVNADGSWSFDPSHASYQHLAAGQSQTLTIPVTVTDSAGAASTQNLVIQLTGTNDGATITGTDVGAVKEDVHVGSAGRISVYGKLDIADIDTGEAAFTYHGPFRGAIQGQYGSLGINTDGSWEYNANNAALQGLREGQQVTDTITVTSRDGTAHAIVITITGTNDAPTVAHALTTTTATEDAAFSVGIPTGTFADIDSGDTLTLSTGTLPAWLHFDATTGTFSGTPTNGDVGTTQVTVTATDSSGAHVSTTFALNVANTNDAPTLNPIATVHTTEDGAQANGRLTATDPDTGEHLTFSIAAPVDGLTFNADGTWSFDPGHASYQHLPDGQVQTFTIPVTVTDSGGLTATQNLVIAMTGRNDGAVISGTDTGTVTEESTLTASGTLAVTDVDSGEAQFTAGTVNGQYGTLTVDASGQWRYALNNAASAVQSLGETQTLTDTVTVQSADGTTHSLTITVAGTNDAPVVAHVVTSQRVNQDAAFNFKLPTDTFTDIDTGDTLSLSTGSLPSWLHFDAATGTFSGTPANGDVGTTQVTVTATDGSGAHVSTTFALNVANTNDAPTLSAMASVRVTEDGAQATGHFTATDPDAGDTLSYSITQPVDGLTVNADGSWSFDPSHASYQHLRAGQTQVLTIPVTVTDSAGATSTQDLVIKINGSNDRAVIAGIDTGTLTEDRVSGGGHQLQASGTLTVADVDTGEAVFQAGTSTGHYGNLLLHSDGQWMYQADNSQGAIQQLKAGDSLTDSFTVHSADGSSHTVTVTIAGRNDAPSLLVRSHSVVEDGARVSGRVLANDVDAGDTQTFSLAHAVAGFTLNADGSYVFDPSNAAYQHLAAGQRLNLAIDVTVTDSAGASDTQPLFITLTGTNDGARISGVSTGDVIEDTNLLGGSGPDASKMVARGQLAISDVDDGQAAFVAGEYAGDRGLGVFRMAADGHWQYVADPQQTAVQALKPGQTLVESAIVRSIDGSTQTLSITIHGTNDRAVITGTDTGRVMEDTRVDALGHLSCSGVLQVSDADAGEAAFRTQHGPSAAGYGEFVIGPSGAWTYVVDNNHPAVQQLGAGQHLTDHFEVRSADGTTHTVTITLDGRDDAPYLHAQSQSVMEDGAPLRGAMMASDIDKGDTLTFAVATPVAGFSLRSDGSYSFDPSHAAYQHLAAGQTQTLSIPVTVTDSAGLSSTRTLAITIAGRDDQAVISGNARGSVTEDASLQTSGRLYVQDADDGEAAFQARVVTGRYGSFSLQPDGHWSYQLDNQSPDVQHLNRGDSITERFTVRSIDGTAQQLAITINGADETPQLVTRTEHVVEDGRLIQGHVQLDNAAAGQSYQYSTSARIPGFSLAADGTYYFSPTYLEYQHLRQDQPLRMEVPVTVTDSHGNRLTDIGVVIDMRGRNDPAVIRGQSHGQVTEDQDVAHGQLQATGRLSVVDEDTGEAHFMAKPALQGHYGSLSIDEHGTWVYTADNSQPDIQHLNAGQLLKDTFTVETVDGSTQAIQIDIAGADEPRPVLQPPAQIQSPPGNHVLQPHLLQSGDIYQQLIDTFLATNSPAYVAAAHAMQAGQSWPLYTVELTINGAGILFTDPQGGVSTQIRPDPHTGSATIYLGALVDFHNANPQGNWVQVFDPQSPGNLIKPWLHNVADEHNLRVGFGNVGGILSSPESAVHHPVSVPFFSPPQAAPAPPASSDESLLATGDATDVVVAPLDAPVAHDHADVSPGAQHYLQFASGPAESATPGASAAAEAYLQAAGVTPDAVQVPETDKALPVDMLVADAAAHHHDNAAMVDHDAGAPLVDIPDIPLPPDAQHSADNV